MISVFDGHNDLLLRLWMTGLDSEASAKLYYDEVDGHIDRKKAAAGGFNGGFFAMFAPQQNATGEAILGTDPVSQKSAHEATDAMFTILETLAKNYSDEVKICSNHDDIIAAMELGAVAALPHIEGAEAIRADLSNLDDYYVRGLRSIGPLWSRPNAFGWGVPLDFPAHPDQGAGLTEAGVELVHAANDKNILIDLSHLNEKGFWDVAKISTKPLVATHSNVYELCQSPRNLTANQLAAIAESDGMVGLNFASGFLREDGRKTSKTPVSLLIRHLDALISALGEDGVGLGSDFDGAIIPEAIGSAAGLPQLTAAMRQADYGESLIQKICCDNWLRIIKATIG